MFFWSSKYTIKMTDVNKYNIFSFLSFNLIVLIIYYLTFES
jgi:hypothetical protein